MKKTIYQVMRWGDEYEIDIEEVDINYVINTDEITQFNTLEEAKQFIIERYEKSIEWYANLIINIPINK